MTLGPKEKEPKTQQRQAGSTGSPSSKRNPGFYRVLNVAQGLVCLSSIWYTSTGEWIYSPHPTAQSDRYMPLRRLCLDWRYSEDLKTTLPQCLGWKQSGESEGQVMTIWVKCQLWKAQGYSCWCSTLYRKECILTSVNDCIKRTLSWWLGDCLASRAKWLLQGRMRALTSPGRCMVYYWVGSESFSVKINREVLLVFVS